jgi:murein DD-endopeptidase MepM/ murein hydrolase activator NlpD
LQRSCAAENEPAAASAQLRNHPSVVDVPSGFPILADPIDDASVSSGFGWRVHPILGVRRFHHGVDLAAARGTPIHAAASGIVEEAGTRGANGLYIRIRHGPQLLTSYSHLEQLATNIHRGAWVMRGQVIGSVGMTGLATGPHLQARNTWLAQAGNRPPTHWPRWRRNCLSMSAALSC